jgi:hypothetical protein
MMILTPDKKRRLLIHKDELEVFLTSEMNFFVSKIALVSLPIVVRLLMNNKYGEPLDLLPFQCVMLKMLWEKKFPMIISARGSGKSFLIAVFALLKAILIPGSKIVIVGAGFRQSKVVFGYIDEIVKMSPIIQEILGGMRLNRVKYNADKVSLKFHINNSEIVGLPLGDGSKIRGFRATTLCADETASINEQVFDVAVSPFLAVKADPARSAKIEQTIKRLYRLGAPENVLDFVRKNQTPGNQLVLSGTASYEFNHFYRRYSVYKMFAQSRGKSEIIKAALDVQNQNNKTAFSASDIARYCRTWHEYAIFQLPYHAIPGGFMDEDMIAQHRATLSPVAFAQEYECKFAKDTFGFFPRSLIEAATPNPQSPDRVDYQVMGKPNGVYVMGVDPARHNDNFAITILYLDGVKAKTVYAESWNRVEYTKCMRRIRELCKLFNIVYIAMDQGGGGDHIADLLANADYLEEDDYPITTIDKDDHKLIPNRVDLIELVNFHTWSKEANHALRADIQTKRLLFPSIIDEERVIKETMMTLESKRDKKHAPPLDEEQIKMQVVDLLHGTLDHQDKILTLGVVREIEGMIDELCTIELQVTEHGTERFGLPKLDDQPEGLDIRRRDRYSALLLAAYAARKFRGTGFKPQLPPALGGTPSLILGQGMMGQNMDGGFGGPTKIGRVIIP